MIARARRSALAFCAILALLGSMDARRAAAADAPAWMHALVGVQDPAHDDKTDAVLLYSETVLSVQANGEIRRLERKAYRILRPGGESYGVVLANFDAQTRILGLRAWCIPISGKDYQVKEGDAVETAIYGVQDGELVSDLRTKVLRIPAATPGNIVGYEREQQLRPYLLTELWDFQDSIPTRQARFSLRLPHGWSYAATWLNHAEMTPTSVGPDEWLWVLDDIEPIRIESRMPPWRGIAGGLVVALSPPNGQNTSLESWGNFGNWYLNLARDRRDTSPEIKQKVAALTEQIPSLLGKMQALAKFVQDDIRYVAIELGIGGMQPHAATQVLVNRYGDCKDKATLLSAMLSEIGVDSYYVLIDTERGAVTAASPPASSFNHAILAIRLPAAVDDRSLLAVKPDAALGRILFFDPTDELTPFGSLRGDLQANVGMLVIPDKGSLVELPQLATSTNAVNRTAHLTLDPDGTLSGEVHEVRYGDRAASQRAALRNAAQATDQIKPVESVLAASLAKFQILKANVANLRATDKPFEWIYEFEAEHYAKPTGDLLLVRPRVFGSKSSGLLETKDPRRYTVEFDGPEHDTDVFEIAIPPGYTVEDLPAPVVADYDFGSYRSKTEVQGRTLRYTRSFEIKQLSVPLSKVADLKEFYRTIAGDERNSAVLKRIASAQ